MSGLQIILVIAGILYYLYSTVNGNEAQKNKKTASNPTPSQKSTMDQLLDKMLEKQKKRMEGPVRPEPETNKTTPKKLVFKENKKEILSNKRQGLPFEKRKLSDAREMPSRKQIEKVVIREKKATEQPIIKVKDYDIDFVDHDLPHAPHHLSDKSNIRFSFKEEEKEHYAFDARQAIIAQIILERKEW